MKETPRNPQAAAGDVTTLDRTMTADDAAVHDALCVLQGPSGITRLSELLAAADRRTERGTAFHTSEVKRAVDRLLAAGHLRRDAQGRLSPTEAHGAQRFGALMADATQAAAWFGAWRRLVNFDRTYSLGFQDEIQLAAAIRLLLYGGGSAQDMERLATLAYSFTPLWQAALERALLKPFDAALFERLNAALRMDLVRSMLALVSGFPEHGTAPLEDWLLARWPADAGGWIGLGPRLAESLLMRGDLAGARRLSAGVAGAQVDLLHACLVIAEGRWAEGTAAFEAGCKRAAAELGRRKNLASPALGWVYLMGLLAQPQPEAWTRARKFAATEAGKKLADPGSFWGIWQHAIDQRLGDAPRSARHFLLGSGPFGGASALARLHHLLLAAWLRVDIGAQTDLSRHAQALSQSFESARMHWLAGLARRAAAVLLGQEADLADAALPFFVGSAQADWREALASILALGGDTAAPAREGAAQDRLIWVLDLDRDGRIRSLEPMEQKAGVRGLGKPKEVSLATLVKRSNLAAHDAAVLRAVQREDYGNRPLLDIPAAAPALVRHPCVALVVDPTRFIEISEALPALEVMTQGEHIRFKLLDPLRTADQAKDEAHDELLPQRWRTQRQRLRQLMVLPDGEGRARLVRLTPAQLRVAELVTQGWQVPVAARAEMDAALRVLSAHFQVHSDAEAGHEVAPNRLLHAELTPQGSGLRLALLAVPFGAFGPRLPPGQGRERATTVHQGVTLFTRRDLAAERQGWQSLLEALPFLDDSSQEWTLDEPAQALAAVEALAALAGHIVSEWPKGKPMRVHAVADGALRLRGMSQGDWLALEGELALDGGQVLQLRQLLDMARESRSRYVALGDGDFLALGDALRQQLADLAALAQPHKQGQRLPGVAALAWQAQTQALAIDGDNAWQQRSQAWAQAQGEAFAPPAGLAAELRDYQLAGYQWLARLAHSGFGGVLADDMGLGKTVQTLALLLQRAAGGPALVVAPTSVCGNWLAEAARFAPALQLQLYGDTLGSDEPEEGDAYATRPEGDSERRRARRRQLRALGPGQVVVCSYALLQIDAEVFSATDWHSLVLDEAQAIKNPGTQRAKAACALKAGFRLALTGTPIENRLGELWSIMAFCNPGLLGSAEQFNQRFGAPIERESDPALKAQATRRLRRLLQPFMLRRTKTEVLTDLPPRTEIVHAVVPGTKERALLEALRQQAQHSVAQALQAAPGAAATASSGASRFQVLAALMKLRRAACDPRLVAPELGIVGAKVLEFEQLALELVAGRHKALVFSQFTDFLALLRERLDLAGLRYQSLDGSTPAAERTRRVAAFQAGEGDLFLISLKAGGFGLNLTVADYVIIADPWWNPAAEEQASARAHRIGQQRPVTVYRLVTQGSIEEKIVRLHRSKRDLAEGILSADGEAEGGAPLDAEELLRLLRDD